jgi:hypothetical protein
MYLQFFLLLQSLIPVNRLAVALSSSFNRPTSPLNFPVIDPRRFTSIIPRCSHLSGSLNSRLY